MFYATALAKLLNKEIDFDSDDIRATLHGSGYTPNRDTHDYVNDLSSELSTAGGYTAGGVALTSKAVTVTAANSWGTAWADETAVAVDYVVRPTTGNGRLYRCVIAGTTDETEPTWPTVVGQTIGDGDAVWECIGRAIVTVTSAAITWADATFTGARYLVVSDRTPGTSATQPLILVVDFGEDKAGGGGEFTYTPNAQGLAYLAVP